MMITTPRLVLVWLLLLIKAGIARADDAETAGELLLIGVEGSAAHELPRVAAEAKALGRVLGVPAGYPKIVTRAEHSEIDAGRSLVAFGLCPHQDAARIEQVLNTFYSEAWTMLVRIRSSQLACPVVAGSMAITQSVSAAGGGPRLSGMLAERKGAAISEQWLELYLRPPMGRLSDSKEIALPPGCTAKLSVDREVIRVEKTCGSPAKSGTEVLRFQGANGKIVPAPALEAVADVRAVMWGGGDTEEAARAALARWEREKEGLKGFLTLPPGYPRIVNGDDYPGLPTGKRLVLLGLCPGERLEEALWTLQAFDARVDPVKVRMASGEPACPTPAAGLAATDSHRVKDGPLSLTIVRFGREPWTLAAYLRDERGELIDWRSDDGKTLAVHDGECPDPSALDAVESKAGKNQITTALRCFIPWDDTTHSYRVKLAYSVAGGRIALRKNANRPALHGAEEE